MIAVKLLLDGLSVSNPHILRNSNTVHCRYCVDTRAGNERVSANAINYPCWMEDRVLEINSPQTSTSSYHAIGASHNNPLRL